MPVPLSCIARPNRPVAVDCAMEMDGDRFDRRLAPALCPAPNPAPCPFSMSHPHASGSARRTYPLANRGTSVPGFVGDPTGRSAPGRLMHSPLCGTRLLVSRVRMVARRNHCQQRRQCRHREKLCADTHGSGSARQTYCWRTVAWVDSGRIVRVVGAFPHAPAEFSPWASPPASSMMTRSGETADPPVDLTAFRPPSTTPLCLLYHMLCYIAFRG